MLYYPELHSNKTVASREFASDVEAVEYYLAKYGTNLMAVILDADPTIVVVWDDTDGKYYARLSAAAQDIGEGRITIEEAESLLDEIIAAEAEGYIHTNAEDYMWEVLAGRIRSAYDGEKVVAVASHQLSEAAPQLRDALINMLGAFDNAACRLKFPGEFQAEAIASAKEALEKAGCPRSLID